MKQSILRKTSEFAGLVILTVMVAMVWMVVAATG